MSLTPIIQPDLQLLDIQRVEVLRGPQGTLYGQGSTGGTIRFLANNPTFEGINGEVGTSFYTTQGGDTSSELRAITNVPVIDDVLAFRVAARYKDVGGWIDQPDAGKEDINDSQTSYVRVKSLWKASDDLSINAMVLRSRNDAGARNDASVKDVSGKTYFRQVDRAGLPLAGTTSKNQSDVYNITINYDLDFAVLTSSSSKVEYENHSESLVGSVSQDPNINSGVIFSGVINEINGFSQEFRLASATDNEFGWVVGAIYADSDRKSGQDSLGLYREGVAVFSGGSSRFFRASKASAFFANVNYQLNEQVVVTAGARYFEDDRTYRFNDSEAKRETFDHVSPMVSLSYMLSNDISIYASISEGFRSGGFNRAEGADEFQPETVRTYEFGSKALLLEGRLSTEFALFHSQYFDYQAADINESSFGRPIVVNPGEVDIEGVEFALQFIASDNLSIGLSGHYVDTEFVKISDTSSSFNLGDPVDYTPKYSASITTKLNFEGPFSAEGFALLDFSTQGGNFNTRQPVQVKSNSIGLLNAQVSLQWESLTARLFGRNLTNERDLLTPVRPPGTSFVQERPRTWGVELSYKFD